MKGTWQDWLTGLHGGSKVLGVGTSEACRCTQSYAPIGPDKCQAWTRKMRRHLDEHIKESEGFSEAIKGMEQIMTEIEIDSNDPVGKITTPWTGSEPSDLTEVLACFQPRGEQHIEIQDAGDHLDADQER